MREIKSPIDLSNKLYIPNTADVYHLVEVAIGFTALSTILLIIKTHCLGHGCPTADTEIFNR